MPKSWTCEICYQAVSELGSYAKISNAKHAHLGCYEREVRALERSQLLADQEAERQLQQARERQAQEEREARERALEERRAEVAERERVNRIEAQRAMPLPSRVLPDFVCGACLRGDHAKCADLAGGSSGACTCNTKHKHGGWTPERPKSRFELLDLDDELVEEK